MSEDTAITPGQQPIIMRSGLVHWVSDDTAEKIRGLLGNQNGHTFLNLTSLAITINTADITGVYTVKEYQDLTKTKQGMYECSFRKWHQKKEECQCETEFFAERRRKEREAKEAEENKPLTDEQRAVMNEKVQKQSELWALEGSPIGQTMYAIGNVRGRRIRRSTVREWEEREEKVADVRTLAINEDN